MEAKPLKNKKELTKYDGELFGKKVKVAHVCFKIVDVESAIAGLTKDFIRAPIGATKNYYLCMVKKWLPDIVEDEDFKELIKDD